MNDVECTSGVTSRLENPVPPAVMITSEIEMFIYSTDL